MLGPYKVETVEGRTLWPVTGKTARHELFKGGRVFALELGWVELSRYEDIEP